MPVRIGDDTDDYCTRCHRLTNHSVAAMVGDEVSTTTCRTCGFQHLYRGGVVPARTGAKAKRSAYDEVLASILGTQPTPPAAPEPKRGKPKR
ncbi:MAG: hypothetical protein ACRD01_10430 [Terriglobales bacterium]